MPFKDPERKRQYTRKYCRNWRLARYGLAEMKSLQDGCCAICNQQSKRLCIDHNHQTGQVRALLCDKCNCALGLFNDSCEALKSAIDYLASKGAA